MGSMEKNCILVLDKLREHPNELISAERLSRELGLENTRTIRRYVDYLRALGCDIEGISKRGSGGGYKLIEAPSLIDLAVSDEHREYAVCIEKIQDKFADDSSMKRFLNYAMHLMAEDNIKRGTVNTR